MTDDADAAPKKRMGRPPKPASEVKRHGVAFRVNDSLREQIQRSADANQRSVAEEVEYRLQLSATVLPLLQTMAADKVSQEFFRVLAQTINRVRAGARRANLDEIGTRLALKSAVDIVSAVNFWTGEELPPEPEGLIGKMNEPPKGDFELPPAAMGHSMATGIMTYSSAWDECMVMADFGDVITDYWSGEGKITRDAEPGITPEPPSRPLEQIMAEINPRDRKRGNKKP